MDYIDKLHSILLSNGMSVRQLCLHCELSDSAVKKILSKTCSPTVDSLGKICAVLGLSLEQLFTYTDERTFKRNERDAAILEALHALPDEANDILLAFLKLIASMF